MTCPALSRWPRNQQQPVTPNFVGQPTTDWAMSLIFASLSLRVHAYVCPCVRACVCACMYVCIRVRSPARAVQVLWGEEGRRARASSVGHLHRGRAQQQEDEEREGGHAQCRALVVGGDHREHQHHQDRHHEGVSEAPPAPWRRRLPLLEEALAPAILVRWRLVGWLVVFVPTQEVFGVPRQDTQTKPVLLA